MISVFSILSSPFLLLSGLAVTTAAGRQDPNATAAPELEHVSAADVRSAKNELLMRNPFALAGAHRAARCTGQQASSILALEADDDTGLLSESEEYLDSTGLDSKQTDLGEYLGVAPRTPLTPVPPTATLTATLAQPGTATLTATLVQQQSESSADAVDGTCGADGRGVEALHSTLRQHTCMP